MSKQKPTMWESFLLGVGSVLDISGETRMERRSERRRESKSGIVRIVLSTYGPKEDFEALQSSDADEEPRVPVYLLEENQVVR